MFVFVGVGEIGMVDVVIGNCKWETVLIKIEL